MTDHSDGGSIGHILGNGRQLLTPQQVCDILQIKRPRLYECVKDRRLPAVKVGRLLRFRLRDVEAFIERSATTR